MDLESSFFVVLASLPLVVPAIWAWFTTKPNPERKHIWIFHNAAAAVGTLTIIFIVVATMIAFLVNQPIGSCGYGLQQPSRCANIPNSLGDISFQTIVYGTFYSAVFGMPALLTHICAEFVTRKREKKAKLNA